MKMTDLRTLYPHKLHESDMAFRGYVLRQIAYTSGGAAAVFVVVALLALMMGVI